MAFQQILHEVIAIAKSFQYFNFVHSLRRLHRSLITRRDGAIHSESQSHSYICSILSHQPVDAHPSMMIVRHIAPVTFACKKATQEEITYHLLAIHY